MGWSHVCDGPAPNPRTDHCLRTRKPRVTEARRRRLTQSGSASRKGSQTANDTTHYSPSEPRKKSVQGAVDLGGVDVGDSEVQRPSCKARKLVTLPCVTCMALPDQPDGIINSPTSYMVCDT